MDVRDFISDCRLFVAAGDICDNDVRLATEGDCVLMCGEQVVAVYPKAWSDRTATDALCLWFNDDPLHAADELELIRSIESPMQLSGVILSVIGSNGGLESFMGSHEDGAAAHLGQTGRHADERLEAIGNVQREVSTLWNGHVGRRAHGRHR